MTADLIGYSVFSQTHTQKVDFYYSNTETTGERKAYLF